MDSTTSAAPRSLWTRFWHYPLRAERLALMRILLGFALLTDQLFQLLPNLADFYSDTGVAPEGLFDKYQMRKWRWTILLFNSGDLSILYPTFALWVLATLLFMIGWQARLMNILVWFMTMCFVNRNPNILNGGDDTMQMGLFLLMLGPTGWALSVDAWFARRKGKPLPSCTPAWPVRLLQIQLCMIYLTTGLAKVVLPLPTIAEDGSTWWDGTSVHYVLNYVTMSRWSYAQLPLPLWMTMLMTYTSVWWEVFFPLLMLSRWTRGPALLFGILFHLSIYLMIEVGWFSFYILTFYGVWVPCSYWIRREQKQTIGERRGLSPPCSAAPPG